MLSQKWTDLIQEIHELEEKRKAVLMVTGGGSLAVSGLLTQAGASNTVIEATVPYSNEAFIDWLGRAPDQFCNEQTALAAAAKAWHRATILSKVENHSGKFLGLACTASLASSRPKRGDHRAHIALHDETTTRLLSITFEKDVRSRLEEEMLLTEMILSQLAAGLGFEQIPEFQLRDNDVLQISIQSAPTQLVELLSGERKMLWANSCSFEKPDHFESNGESPIGVLSGSFAPLHEGHLELREVAQQILGGRVDFEMAIHNAEKPPIDFMTLKNRLDQFQEESLLLTTRPIFQQKSEILPDTVFVVGFDTAARILEPRFYGDDVRKRDEALENIKSRGCRFLVAARLNGNKLGKMSDLHVPQQFAEIFTEIPDSQFRLDISSTELRSSSLF